MEVQTAPMAVKRAIWMICTIAALFFTSSAQICKSYKFSDNKVFESCTDLPVLQAHQHWNFDPSKKTVQIAYQAKQTPNGWVTWGINPTRIGMIGTQALVAFQDSNGKMKVHSTQVTSYSTTLEPETLTFPVSELSGEYLNDEMIIFAVLGPMSNGTTYSTVWQAGNSVSDGIPQTHPLSGPNIRSLETLDFLSA